jgi:chromosome segregation ATPase
MTTPPQTPTPRTAKALWKFSDAKGDVVSADFARELERENTALRSELASETSRCTALLAERKAWQDDRTTLGQMRASEDAWIKERDALRARVVALEEALDDSQKGLEVARKALATAEYCMASHEMQDSKWDNARNIIYTAKVASFATGQRARAALAAYAQLKSL